MYSTPDGARKRARTDQGPSRDIYNLSNDHLYELPKHLGTRHRVRQTFGQLEVEHAYPALKLQLPFVSILATISCSGKFKSFSTKHDCQNRMRDPSTGHPFNSMPMWNVDFQRCGQPRKRKTNQGALSAKEARLPKHFDTQAISVYGKTQITSCGNIL